MTMATLSGDIRIAKIRKSGASYIVTLPKDFCLELGMTPSTNFVSIRMAGRCLVITRATDVETNTAIAIEADAALADLTGAVKGGK